MKSMNESKKPLYPDENPDYSIIDSMNDSVRFVLKKNLKQLKGRHFAHSTFVDVMGNPQHWHEFGDIEGLGWASNAFGASLELYEYGKFFQNNEITQIALSIADHGLYNGFINPETFFIKQYRHIPTNKFFNNYKHNEKFDDWICPGSYAKIGTQLLSISDIISAQRDNNKRNYIFSIINAMVNWLENVKLTRKNWFPRRCFIDGNPFKKKADGKKKDPIYDCSADGLYILQFYTELTKRNIRDFKMRIKEITLRFIKNGGYFGSINHDTYDKNECVAYAEAFLILRDISILLHDKVIKDFAYTKCLNGLKKFQMNDDRNNVATKGLLYMEDSWDTAYLWENAQASLAFLVAFKDTMKQEYLNNGLTILRAISKHHHGPFGFLTEGVDWNNRVGQEHHIDQLKYGDIKYTEPFLNNLHILTPTLYFLNKIQINH